MVDLKPNFATSSIIARARMLKSAGIHPRRHVLGAAAFALVGFAIQTRRKEPLDCAT
jgi:hypothetical protein